MTDDFIFSCNLLTNEECDYTINFFETLKKDRPIFLEKRNNISVQDEQCFLSVSGMWELFGEEKFINLQNKFWNAYKEYSQKYWILQHINEHSVYDWKIQKTLPSQGFHEWHCEDWSPEVSTRVATFVIYLNDVEEGGETEFLFYHKRFKPKKGMKIGRAHV